MNAAAPDTFACELVVSPLARIKTGTTETGAPLWSEDPARRKGLRDKPRGFKPFVGSYREVMEEATRLNAEQAATGRWDYLYNPDILKS